MGAPSHTHTHTKRLQIVRVDLLAFSLEEIRIAGAHGDPREDHHQDPWRAGNKSDPSSALASLAFYPRLLPPAFSLPFTPLFPLVTASLKSTASVSSFFKSPTSGSHEAHPLLMTISWYLCLCWQSPPVPLIKGHTLGRKYKMWLVAWAINKYTTNSVLINSYLVIRGG